MDFQAEGQKGTSNPERRPGDWVCSDCGQLNFQSRNKCFRGCAVFRPGDSAKAGGSWDQYEQPWRERERGFTKKMNTDIWGRPTKTTQDRRPGDWICSRCNVLNYTSRQQCFKCDAKKHLAAQIERPVHNSGGGMLLVRQENSGGSRYFCPNCPCQNCNRPSGGAGGYGMRNSFIDPYPRGASMMGQNLYNPYPSSGFQPFAEGDRRPGDWDCPSCRGHNYADKKACFKCGIPKPAGIEVTSNRMGYSGGNFPRQRNIGGSERRPGDWDCPSCNAHNYASKIHCFVCKKPKPKDIEKTESFGAFSGNRRPGDWDCPECQAHNYADKTACFKCKIPKPEDT